MIIINNNELYLPINIFGFEKLICTWGEASKTLTIGDSLEIVEAEQVA